MSVAQCRLVDPTVDLEQSHKGFLEEFRARCERVVPWIVEESYRSFDEYVAMLRDAARGIGVPEGFVPHSTHWLLDGHGEIVAVANLRHGLTESLFRYGGHIGYGVRPSARRRGYGCEVLRQTLREAKRRGIDRARLTCDKDNTASAKTILRNGGRLDAEEYMAEHGHIVQRYWIEVPPTDGAAPQSLHGDVVG